MVGAGCHVFALMGYVIANHKPDKVVGGQVTLNPKLLSVVFGEDESRIQEAIDYLCSPDPKSRNKAEEGRRLVKIGEFEYKVVSAAIYRQIRNEEERRESNRVAQEKFRKKPKPSKPLKAETIYCEAERNGATIEQLDNIVTDNLPKVNV